MIKKDNWVSVEYTGSFDNGEVFDSNIGREYLTFKVGANMVIKGFDKAVMDMSEGQEKEIHIEAKDAYGKLNEEQFELPKDTFEGIDIEIGKSMELMSNQGPVSVQFLEDLKDNVKVTINHPMAGKNLNFKIKVVKTYSKDEEEKLDESLEKECCGGGCHEEEDCGEGECHKH